MALLAAEVEATLGSSNCKRQGKRIQQKRKTSNVKRRLRQHTIGLESVLARSVDGRGGGISFLLFLIGEELYKQSSAQLDDILRLMFKRTVHDVEAFFVDFQVLMMLQVVNSNHTASLFNVLRILVHATGTRRILINLSNLEDVLKTVKGNLNYFVVHRSKKVTHGLDATLRDEVSDLVRFLETTRSGIGDGPTCFLLGFEISVGEDVDEGRDNVTGIKWSGTIIVR